MDNVFEERADNWQGTSKTKFVLTFILCWVTYSLTYFCRVNWSVSMPFLAEEFGWNHLSLGTVASGFFIAYAIGQLVNGIIGDRFNPRYFVAFGMVFSAGCNILISGAKSYSMILLLWTLNGFFQSMIWGPVIRTLSSVTPNHLRIAAGTLMSTSMVAGYLICYKVVGKVAESSWNKAFLIPGIVFIINALVWVCFVDLKPEKPVKIVKQKKSSGNSQIKSFWKFIVVNGLIVTAIACIVHGIIKESISTWAPTLIVENYSISKSTALNYLSFIPIANLVGILLSGWLSNKDSVNHGKNLSIFFMVSAIVSAVLIFFISSNLIVTIVCLGLISGCMFAINSIVLSIIPMSYAKSGRISSVAGFLDFSAYFGSAISGPVIGLSSGKGWSVVVLIWVVLSLLGIATAILEKKFKQNVRSLS